MINRLKAFTFLFLDDILYFLFILALGTLTYSLNIKNIFHFEVKDGWIMLDLLSMLCIFIAGGGIHKISTDDEKFGRFIMFIINPHFNLDDIDEERLKDFGHKAKVVLSEESGIGGIVVTFFKNIIFSVLSVIFLPFQILACLVSNKYAKDLAMRFDCLDLQIAILPSIFLIIAFFSTMITCIVRMKTLKIYQFENQFNIVVSRKDITIEPYDTGFRTGYKLKMNIDFTFKEQPDYYYITGFMVIEDKNGNTISEGLSGFNYEYVEYYHNVVNEYLYADTANSSFLMEFDCATFDYDSSEIYLLISKISYENKNAFNYGYDYYKIKVQEELN